MRKKSISSSSRECSLDGNDRKGQIENGECSGEKLVASQENGFKERATSSSSVECSLNGNGERDHIEDGECYGEQLVTSQENGFREKAASSSSGECSLNGNGGKDHIEDGKCNGEQPDISQENDLRAKITSSSSGQCSLNGNGGKGQIENGECIGEQRVTSQEDGLWEKGTSSSSGECSLDGNDGRDQVGNGDCNGKRFVQINSPEEELENEMDVHKLSDMRRHIMSNNGYSDELTHFEIEASAELMVESSVENAKNANLQQEGEEISNGNVPLEGAVEQLISARDKEDASDEKFAPVQVKSEVDIARNDIEVVEELNNGNLLLEGAEQELFSESDREVNNDKPPLIGAKPEVDIHGSKKAGSEALNNRKLSLEVREEVLSLCASDGEDPKHNQSGSNHASSKTIHHTFNHVRSVDTFDNTEAIHPGFETSGTLGGLSKASTSRIYHAYDGSISSNDGVDEQFPNQYLDSFETSTVANGVSEGGSRKGKGLVNSALHGDLETQQQSYFAERKPHVPKDSRRNQNEVSETTRHGHAHWMRTKKDEFPPKIPHRQSGSQSGYESGSTSNQMQDEFYCSSSYLSPDSFDDPDHEKMKLLRMVYKLQDQLNRTSYASGETNGRPFMGSQISAYQSHDLHERKFYHGLDYPRCDGICSSHGINCFQKHNFSRIPYIAEPTSSTHLVDHSRFPCCQQQWQCSAELPRRVLYQHDELYRPSPDHNCCSPHHSYASSPQWFTSNLLAHGHETKSCDQRLRPEVKKHFREKPMLTRRHYRPVAGGAPFVTCHKCFKLLQLPADFLLFKRVCHQLKCGACQEILKFSLQNGSHIVSYAPNALEPPSSNHVSYSDDCGPSVDELAVNSSNVSSETEAHSLPKSSPLHQLMGYSSPRQVITGIP
uniref:Uncharacterized protein At5g05190 family n=1 Tax=Cajanus cajan TaxID=3821 RepID=A0A151U0A0_CAJCA|nr:Uncharacterized protein At5g05190 family [Cajanus cajan]